MTALAHLRSLLFVPGSDERKLARALTSGADAVVADLEDAVVPAGKGAARELVARLLAEPAPGSARIVRINGAHTDLWEDDLAAIAPLGLDAVMGAYEQGLAEGRGAVSLDGKLIDAPVAERARAILERRRPTEESA